MATIYNSELSRELREGAKIQTSRDTVPNQLGQTVVPVMEVNPKLLRRANIVKNTELVDATSAIIYTTPADRDFYLTGYWHALRKDATSTSTVQTIKATIGGALVVLYESVTPTLTAAVYQPNNVDLTTPIKIDRNTNIIVTSNTATSTIVIAAGLRGYLDDVSNA